LARQIPELEGEQSGIGQQRLVTGFVEQVDEIRVGECFTGPGALAHTSDTEEEKAPRGSGNQAAISRDCHVVVIIPGNMTI
jgi:hypothetical protein